MIGAIVGDVVGSRFEWDNTRTKDFKLFTNECFFTDDTVMSLAICQAFLATRSNHYKNLQQASIDIMQLLGRKYRDCTYGSRFRQWLNTDHPLPYNSYGNGAAMRVSACGYVGQTLEEVRAYSKAVTEISHNHPEGLKGAEATAISVYLARTGGSKNVIKSYIQDNYYLIDFTIDEIRPSYSFQGSCQGTVPYALQAFFESNSFEETLRTVMYLGGDSDTLGAIAGAVAGAYYGVPKAIRENTMKYLDSNLICVIEEFERTYRCF